MENDLLNYYSSSVLIPNCLSLTWDTNNNVFTCNKCNLNYYLHLNINNNADTNNNKKCYSYSDCLALYDSVNNIYPYAVMKYKGAPVATTNTFSLASNNIDTCVIKTSNAALDTNTTLTASKKCKVSPSTNYQSFQSLQFNLFYNCVYCPDNKPIKVVTKQSDIYFVPSMTPLFITQTDIAIDQCYDSQDITGHVVHGLTNGIGVIQNCEYYYKDSQNDYGCLSCKKGYRGKVKSLNS